MESASASTGNNDAQMSINNVIKIEKLQKEIEVVKTDLLELKTQPQLDLNSNNTIRWFKTKFEAYLQGPESRRYIKDTIDTKLAAFQVGFLPNFFTNVLAYSFVTMILGWYSQH